MTFALVILIAIALAGLTYLWLERVGTKAWPAIACRAVAWAALGMLLVNLTCALPASALKPMVLFDGSLSMGGAGGRWREALDTAKTLGEVHWFGDERGAPDTVPSAGRSLLGPAVVAAAASGRPVIVVSDGEVEDVSDIPPELLSRVGVRTFPRQPANDIALTRVNGPALATVGDTITVSVEVQVFGTAPGDSLTLELRTGRQVLLRRRISAATGGVIDRSFSLPTTGLSGGDHVIEARLVNLNDAEPRDDTRLWLLRIAPTPGVVLIASPGDWDARFLYRSIRDVAQLPVRGYVRLEPGSWRAMETLAPSSSEDVAQSARRADLLVIKGSAPELLRNSRARGIWLWPSGETGEAMIPADWYVSAGVASPIAGALVGLPVDSFPPLSAITPIEPGAGDWVALTVQESRRGAERPVFTGSQTGSTRRVLTAADGFWRWSFRGGSSEQGYRSLVAATVSWLLGATDSTGAKARPVRTVVANARPVVFEWTGAGEPQPLTVQFSDSAGQRSDTLQFDGSGHAEVRLPVGTYHYRLEASGEGTVAVEQYSDEWLPRTMTLQDHPVSGKSANASTSARQWLWLFGLCITGLAGEWWTRRRLGLR